MKTDIQCSFIDNIILKNIFGSSPTILFNRVFIGNLESILEIKKIKLHELISINKYKCIICIICMYYNV